jgi:hypothetical protein
MTITKKQWTIIGVVVAIIAIWYFFLRKKKAESNFTLPPDWVRKGLPPPLFPQGSVRQGGGGAGRPPSGKYTPQFAGAGAGAIGGNIGGGIVGTSTGVSTLGGGPTPTNTVGTPCIQGRFCGANQICVNGRCAFSSGSHW